MQNKRRYERRSESLQMSVKSTMGDTRTYTTRDISDGGVFLFAPSTQQLPVGTEIIISPVHTAAGVTSPTIKGRVVRSSAQGIGVEFLEPGFS